MNFSWLLPADVDLAIDIITQTGLIARMENTEADERPTVSLHTVEAGTKITFKTAQAGEAWIATSSWGKNGKRNICHVRTGGIALYAGVTPVVVL